ncbi:hypothetical protein CYG49_02930 [Candidatus Saccharibacteria bacterium]|nr:MAG: hypothetical protein CYG49_02930 [Candidatus Saccharibacteria bacterium]
MNQDQYQLATQKKVLKAVSLALGALLLLLLLIFIGTHGIVKIERSNESGTYTLHKLEADKPEGKAFEGGWRIVRSGEYTLVFEGANVSALSSVNVPSFFRSTTASFKDVAPRQVRRVATGTLHELTYGSNTEVLSISNNTSTMMLAHRANDPTGMSAEVRPTPPFSFQKVISNDRLLSLKATDDEEYIPHVFNFKTNAASEIQKVYVDENFVSTIQGPQVANSTNFAVHYGEGNDAKLDVFRDTQLIRTFASLKDTASNEEGLPATSIGNTFTAIGYGEGFVGASDDSHEEQRGDKAGAKRDYLVKLFSNSTGKEEKTINLGNVNDVAQFAVPDDGKHVAVQHTTTLSVYNDQAKRLFSYDLSYVTDLRWLDNNRLLFDTVDRGIFVLDVSARRATSAFANTPLRVSSFNVTGNQVLFSAFSGSNSVPDGYVIDLDTAATDGNALIKKLPYTDGTIALSTLDNIIYAAPVVSGFTGPDPEFRPVQNIDESTKKAVTDYLQKNIPNYTQYKLVYGENL